jgi:hypothetical protein
MAKKRPLPSLKDHEKQGQLPIHTNAVYVGDSLNVYLTYDQAVQAATNPLKKAEMVKGDDGRVVQLWTKKGSSKLYFGINAVVQKGSRNAWE